jgi:hypothetical protein
MNAKAASNGGLSAFHCPFASSGRKANPMDISGLAFRIKNRF